MKKILCLVVACLVFGALVGCSGKQEYETDMTPADIAAAIQQGQQEIPVLIRITPEDEDFNVWLSDYYFLQTGQVLDGVICYADGAEASEFAVLLMRDEKDCEEAEKALQEYIGNRAGAFEGYAPQQAAMVKEGIVAVNGRYVALLICPEPQSAKEAFSGCFGKSTESGGNNTENGTNKADIGESAGSTPSPETEEPREPDGTEDLYNAEAVLQAYRSGDDSALSDIFSIGHTSTAVSLACGLAKGRDVKGEHYNVVAVVGDGALSGGEAFEGLNNAAAPGSNIILIVNDNDMSIAENHGGIYQNLRRLRETGGKLPCNLFRALGFEYIFVRDGNDYNEIADALYRVKDWPGPVVLHMCTVKGKGYLPAEADKENWHYRAPFDLDTGRLKTEAVAVETYEALTALYLADKMKKDPEVTAITAGTPKALGFEEDLRKQFPKQFVDVGIAEGHAVAFASGMAKAGAKPVFGVSSSFLQRAYDQLSSDLALNKSPAVILVFFAGIAQGSQTHMGVFDISLAANIPGIIYLAPTCKEEYFSMLEWAMEQTAHPVMIRVPGVAAVSRDAALLPEYDYPAKYEIVEQGTDVAVLALGKFFGLGQKVSEKLRKEHGIHATLINPRYASAVDEEVLNALPGYGHKIVVTLEDGITEGGFGEKIARFYGNSPVKVFNFGAKKEFVDHVAVEEQYRRYRLTPEQIVSDIWEEIKNEY